MWGGFKKMKKYKRAFKYVTFIPTDEEFWFAGTINGYAVFSDHDEYLEYGFHLIQDPTQGPYYQFTIDTIEKTKLFTNAYKLCYSAIYKVYKFEAGVTNYPRVVLFSDNQKLAESLEFEHINKEEWIKNVNGSEVEIITEKTPIDLVASL